MDSKWNSPMNNKTSPQFECIKKYHSTKWYQKKQLQYSYPIVNGKKHGIEKWWYENGQLANTIPYINGERNGMLRYYDNKGGIRMELNYKDGIHHGLEVAYGEANHSFNLGDDYTYNNKLIIITNKNGFNHGICAEITPDL